MEIMTDPPRRMLVVTPHPDDAEGGCGGTMARWIAEAGTEVVVLMCTNGDKGTEDHIYTPATLAATREQEQLNASAVLGVKEVVFLRHPDGGLEDTLLFRSQVVREIRRHRPDIIFGIDPYRTTSHTHRDHRHSGQVAIDAAFSYAWSYLHFPEQIVEEGLLPHQVKEAYLWGSQEPDVFVDTSNYLDLKARSLLSHVSQFPNPAGRAERVKTNAAEVGQKAGLAYAEGFRRIPFNIGSLEWRLLYS